jgi:ribonuclease PH
MDALNSMLALAQSGIQDIITAQRAALLEQG